MSGENDSTVIEISSTSDPSVIEISSSSEPSEDGIKYVEWEREIRHNPLPTMKTLSNVFISPFLSVQRNQTIPLRSSIAAAAKFKDLDSYPVQVDAEPSKAH